MEAPPSNLIPPQSEETWLDAAFFMFQPRAGTASLEFQIGGTASQRSQALALVLLQTAQPAGHLPIERTKLLIPHDSLLACSLRVV